MDRDPWREGTVIVLTSSRALAGKRWAWYWIYDGLRRIEREYPAPYLLIEGCAKGGDHMAATVATLLGWTVKHEPCKAPEWCQYGRSAGHRRNARMLAYRPDVVIAFPWGEARGTRGCIAMARKLGLRTMVMTRLRRPHADPTQDRAEARGQGCP